MSNTIIQTIKNKLGDWVLPVTHPNAVIDSDGDNLTKLLKPAAQGGGIGTCTSSGTTALTMTIEDFKLATGGLIAVTFTNAVPAGATLNISNGTSETGAKSITHNGASIPAGVIPAGSKAVLSFNGTSYELITVYPSVSTYYERRTDFDLSVLKQAVADGNLEKYGLKVGDYKTINGYDYVIADLNTMKGTRTPYRLTVNHVGLIVIPHTTHAWNASGNTYTGADGRGAGYANSDLHYYLKTTVLPHVQNDLGANNLLSHSKLLSKGVNTTGYNRFGTNSGCTNDWAWYNNEYISALSEVQVYGSITWSSSGHDTGEACRQLEVFKKYSHTEIFKGEYPWLRDVSTAALASIAHDNGYAVNGAASDARYVAALILFN